jgi:hypothetical protein
MDDNNKLINAINNLHPVIHSVDNFNPEPSLYQLIYHYYKLYLNDEQSIKFTNLYINNWINLYNK